MVVCNLKGLLGAPRRSSSSRCLLLVDSELCHLLSPWPHNQPLAFMFALYKGLFHPHRWWSQRACEPAWACLQSCHHSRNLSAHLNYTYNTHSLPSHGAIRRKMCLRTLFFYIDLATTKGYSLTVGSSEERSGKPARQLF